ncbi:MAG: zinc metalloprotease HtpX [Desulfatiglans sp.]|jgi:heat shock protein HtpX|nr:zinc metalloprotease HtpX [Thermodesulfobacteriota bacterium]MEE4353218.1 zinc metalloprotease HtpX [Desulfatiglans sp.]
MGNWFKTSLLLGLLTALIVWIGDLLGGRQGMIIAFLLAMGINFFSYWYSDKIVLKTYKAREVIPQENHEIYQIVQDIARKADLPVPRVYIIPEKSPNAFATGRNPEHAAVAVTEGLLQLMDRDEIMGVISHEMAHIKNMDILIGSIAATMAGAIMIIANMARWTVFLGGGSDNDEEGGLGFIGLIIMSILAPLAAMLIQMAISRSREYHADETGASLAGQPFGLADALEKLGAYSRQLPMHSNPSTAHMFIVNPLRGHSLTNLFSTHPPLEERIARLRGIRPSVSKQPSADSGLKKAEDFWKNLK